MIVDAFNPPSPSSEAMCVHLAAVESDIPEEILWAVRIVEGGKPGLVKKNTDGSVDVGVMQINSVHFPSVEKKYGYEVSQITWSPCASIHVASLRIRAEIARAKDFWRGVGSYHSRTKKLNAEYVRKIQVVLERNKYSRKLLQKEAAYYYGQKLSNNTNYIYKIKF